MSLRRSAGLAAALFSSFLAVGFGAGCSSKTYRDVNYGSDLGVGWRPEVGDTGPDGDASETPASGSGGSSGTGGSTAAGTGGTGGDAGGDVTDDAGADGAPDALDNG